MMMGKSHTGRLAAPVDAEEDQMIIGKRGVHLSELVTMFRRILAQVSPEIRVEIFDAIGAGYCPVCGVDDPRCQCGNDE
jgi:hypothetical protein